MARPLERLNGIHNRAKHVENAINSGQFLEDAPLCVWLTNDGLRSTDAMLSFEEITEILTELARWADAVQDPTTMREKLQEQHGS